MRGTYTPAGYWEKRYRDGRSSGAGSEGKQAAAKAAHVNDVIARYGVRSVIDWGCGDGTVLSQITTDISYLGIDVSPTILAKVRKEHPGRRFAHPEYAMGGGGTWHLALSMDVLFHLPDDGDYHAYLDQLFGSSGYYVLIYSTNYGPDQTARHVYRRRFTPDIAARYPDWDLIEQPDQPHPAGFYLYQRQPISPPRVHPVMDGSDG